MRYTKIPSDTFKQLQLNSGILLSDFDPVTGSYDDMDILGATSGGVNFTATPSYSDYGEDIDNCPKNTKELKKLDNWEVKMAGNFVTVTTARAKSLIGAADIDSADANKVKPRNDVLDADFSDIWWVGDYSDKNGDSNGGFIAIKLINALSTGGFSIQSGDRAKGQFAFEYTGHYSMSDQSNVPFEVYAKAGSAETFTITYDGNGSTGGTVPLDSGSPYDPGTVVTVLGNTGTLAKTGKTFGGWNTKADGTGTAYAAAATFAISANTTLYAQWS